MSKTMIWAAECMTTFEELEPEFDKAEPFGCGSEGLFGDQVQPAYLKDFLLPQSQQTLAGHCDANPIVALQELAQDAIRTKAWANQNNVPMNSHPLTCVQEAARRINVSVKDANAVYEQASQALESQKSDLSGNLDRSDQNRWATLSRLDPELYRLCLPYSTGASPQAGQPVPRSGPPQDLPDAEVQPQPSAQPFSRWPQLKPRPNVSGPVEPTVPLREDPASAGSSGQSPEATDASSHPPAPDHAELPTIQVQYEQNSSSFLSPAEQRDCQFAKLGRAIVEQTGIEENNILKFEGKANYTITVNRATNTMRITAQDRGNQTILVDADGKIDHKNSQVTDIDIAKFTAVLRILNQAQAQEFQSKGSDYQR